MKVKMIFKKHWNCIPWFITGIYTLIVGNITRLEYAGAWICVILLLWEREWGDKN